MKRATCSTRLMAWELLAVGDRVQKSSPCVPLSPSVEDDSPGGCRQRIVVRYGTVTEKLTTPGGLPEVWVQWDEERMSVPESPDRLVLLTSTSAASLQRQEVSAA